MLMKRRRSVLRRRDKTVGRETGLPLGVYGQGRDSMGWAPTDARVSHAPALPRDARPESLAPAAIQS